MTLVKFGARLVRSKDLDPVYVVLYQAKLPQERLHKWLLAYWCFYNCGTASWITDQSDYWKAMAQAAASKNYPRGRDRRHYRGGLAIESVAWLKKRGLERLFEPFTVGVGQSVAAVIEYVCTWYGFGGWIAFKVADMLERLKVAPISFEKGGDYFFDPPIQGALQAFQLYASAFDLKKVKGTVAQPASVQWAISYLRNSHIGTMMAPPSNNRLMGVQEFETILCKWHAHMTSGYKIGEDIEYLKKSLKTFPYESPTKRTLLRVATKEFK